LASTATAKHAEQTLRPGTGHDEIGNLTHLRKLPTAKTTTATHLLGRTFPEGFRITVALTTTAPASAPKTAEEGLGPSVTRKGPRHATDHLFVPPHIDQRICHDGGSG
jgi:hypothetical protein